MYYQTSDAINPLATSSCSSPLFFLTNNLVPGRGPAPSSPASAREEKSSAAASQARRRAVASARGARGQLIPGTLPPSRREHSRVSTAPESLGSPREAVWFLRESGLGAGRGGASGLLLPLGVPHFRGSCWKHVRRSTKRRLRTGSWSLLEQRNVLPVPRNVLKHPKTTCVAGLHPVGAVVLVSPAEGSS